MQAQLQKARLQDAAEQELPKSRYNLLHWIPVGTGLKMSVRDGAARPGAADRSDSTLRSFPSLVMKFLDLFLHFPAQKLAVPVTQDWALQSDALSRQASPFLQELLTPLAQKNGSKIKIKL